MGWQRRCVQGAQAAADVAQQDDVVLVLQVSGPGAGAAGDGGQRGVAGGLGPAVRDQGLQIGALILAAGQGAARIQEPGQFKVVRVRVGPEPVVADGAEQTGECVAMTLGAAVGQQLGDALGGKVRRRAAGVDQAAGVFGEAVKGLVEHALAPPRVALGEEGGEQTPGAPGDVGLVEILTPHW